MRNDSLPVTGGCLCGAIRYEADFLMIWMGTLDQPEAYEPQAHYWTDSKIAWVDIHSDLPDVTKNLPPYKVTIGAAEKD